MIDLIAQSALLALAVAGLAISIYFTGVTYRLFRPDLRFIPRVCRMEEGSCRQVVDTRQARVFGLPNSLLGIVYYAGLAALAGVSIASPEWPLPAWIGTAGLITAWGTVALGVVLSWSLLFQIRVPCVLCFTSHLINLAIALLLSAPIRALG